MTWNQFLRYLGRINLILIFFGWGLFWGYGLLVNDVPPLSVIPELMFLTVLVCAVVSIAFFLASHFTLMWQAARRGEVPPIPRFVARSLLAIAISILIAGLASMVDHTIADQVNAALSFFAIGWSVVTVGSLIAFMPHLVQSYFKDDREMMT